MSAQQRRSELQENRQENARRVLAFIRTYINQHGISPSLDEIAKGCHMSRSNVVRYLDFLEAWGYLTRTPGIPRSISLLEGDRCL